MRSVFFILAVAASASAAAYSSAIPDGPPIGYTSRALPPIDPTGVPDSETTTTSTVYTTTTVCPVTRTHTYGSSVAIETLLTTSTITVTKCLGGCHKPTGGHHKPTGDYPPPPPVTTTTATTPDTPGATTITHYYPKTITGTITSFVPCSTLLPGSGGHGPVYSTYLTPTYIPTTYVTTQTSCETLLPTPTPYRYGDGPVCPPPTTVYATIISTVYAPPPGPTPCPGGPHGCGHYETHTYTSTLPNGETTTTTIALPPNNGGHHGGGGHGHGTGTGTWVKPTGGLYPPPGHKPSGTGSKPTDTKPTTPHSLITLTPTAYATPEPTYAKRWFW